MLFFPRVATGEKISLTAAHSGRKSDQNGYPVPEGITGLLCTEDYKYCGLALQVGGWAARRQPVTVKTLIVWKPKLWPPNSLSGRGLVR